MKKLSVISGVLLLLTLAQVGQAADLQAGWYANIDHIYVYVAGQYGPDLLGAAQFLTTPGQYDPFLVTDGAFHRSYTRYASVPANFYGAQPQQSLVLPFDLGLAQGAGIAYLYIASETNYDSHNLDLQVWQRSTDGSLTQLWSQPLSGHIYGVGDFAYDATVNGSYFVKIAIVPEPSSLLSVVMGLLASVACCRRRRG